MILPTHWAILLAFWFLGSKNLNQASTNFSQINDCMIVRGHSFWHLLGSSFSFSIFLLRFLRAVSYRWLVRWICGYMGWDNTRPLPACVYHNIHWRFQSEQTRISDSTTRILTKRFIFIHYLEILKRNIDFFGHFSMCSRLGLLLENDSN